MSRVSERGEELFTQLVAWEMLGREDLDPQVLLRQVSFTDLCVAVASLKRDEERAEQFVSTLMVRLELQYRHGDLDGDWKVERDGSKVQLHYSPRGHMSVQASRNIVGIGAEI